MLAASLLMIMAAVAQEMPVHFSTTQKRVGDDELAVTFSATIDKGWHLYSTGLGDIGPTSAELHTEKAEGVKPIGTLRARGKEINEYDDMFGARLRYFENSVTFEQRYKITGERYAVAGYLLYGACNDQMCLPPSQVEFSYKGEGVKDAKEEASDTVAAAAAVAAADSLGATATDSVAAAALAPAGELWAPSIEQLQALNGDSSDAAQGHSWLYLFAMGLLGGLLALFTPCVWPIIPMTVSFFLKRAKDNRGRGIRDAVTYGISIVVIYLALGLIVTAIFGPQKLNELSTNAPFNIFFFVLLVVFALSFFGWFELRLPSSWGNKVDSKANTTTGLLSIFLMAFTLVLVSFSCTAPVVGLLLVQTATSGNIVGPAMGMLGFALALALPFTLFALFPSWIKKAPKSGSWMNILKVTLGFIELAFALKFLSVADLAYGWRILDREVFLSLWIVIFGCLGLYLLGFLKFQSDTEGGEERKPMPVLCIMLGMVSLAFTVYMIPGLWGAPCKAVSAFAPPMYTQDFNLNEKEVRAAYTNYEEGMAAAAAAGKPVLLDFTGFGCVNCRKMEAAVWTDPRVASLLTDDYVLISLYVDDKTPLARPDTVANPDGSRRVLRTIGDRWSFLQVHKFGSMAQPLYVAVDAQGQPLTGSFAYREDVPAYIDFLKSGLDRYKNK